MISHMSSINRIVDYYEATDEEIVRRSKSWCKESLNILTRTTSIYGHAAMAFTKDKSVGQKFFEQYAPIPSCMCDGCHCVYIHSTLALLSMLCLLNIDPETII
jgi:hypothetical protein